MASDWDGTDAFYAVLDRLASQADTATKVVVAQVSALMISTTQANFSGSHRKGLPHVGGNKPNIVSGDLRRSITADPIRRYGNADYGTTVGPKMIYGRRVELGYKGSRAYPYFSPGIEALKPKLAGIANQVWNKYVKG